MKISEKALNQIKIWEGYRDRAYKCPSGVWTIGYGHTAGVKEGMSCTMQQADEWLRTDILFACSAVERFGEKYNFTQGQIDALVSFTFNCGRGNLCKLLNNGKRTIQEIAEHLPLYDKSNGKTLIGLQKRRLKELEWFMETDNTVYFPKYTGDSCKIDEVFEDIGAFHYYDMQLDKPWKRRKRIAEANGFSDYTGKASENFDLIYLAKCGKLVCP